MGTLAVTKMNGCGNTYGIIEDLDRELERQLDGYDKLAIAVSDQHYGIWSDGILVAQEGEKTNYRMRVFNKDGSEAEMCGNGIRIFARYLHDKGMVEEREFPVETYDGSILVTPRLNFSDDAFESVTVDMGKGKIHGKDKEIGTLDKRFRYTRASIGNPHCVIFDSGASEEMAKKYGRYIENHFNFYPKRTNVEFARIICPDWIDLYVWERGSGFTQACGTGACATAFVGHKIHGTDKDVEVVLPGGILYISIMDDDSIQMTGPAEYNCEAEFDWEQLLSHFEG